MDEVYQREKQNSLEQKINERKNKDPRTQYISEQSNKVRNTIKRIRENNGNQNLDEKTRENKQLYEEINQGKVSKTKDEAYTFLSKFLGIDMYDLENKKQIKKAYKLLDDVKKETKNIEKIINGEVTYNPPALDEQSLFTYWSSINPKKKGLSFLNQEYQDVTILLKEYEEIHKNNIEIYEDKIKEIDEQMMKAKTQNGNSHNFFKEKHNLIRLKEREKENLDAIESELNNYIIDKTIVKINLNDAKNAVNLNKQLIDVAEISFKIIGYNVMTPEGKAIDAAYTKMEELREKIDHFKGYIEEFATGKNSKAKTRYDKVQGTIGNNRGEKISKEISTVYETLNNESKSSMKAMRDTYFEELGY